MNKRRLHHYWRKFRLVKPWYLLIVAIIFGVISIMSLKSNYQHMVVLRSAVYAADKNDGNVMQALNNLRTYVNGHMNTSLTTADGVYPPIQLKYTYDRLVTAESARVASINQQLYTQAQAYCQEQDPVDFSGHNRVPCIDDYINTHGAKQQTIPDALYKFGFASPSWSPDRAGLSIVATGLSALAAVVLFIAQRWLKRHVA